MYFIYIQCLMYIKNDPLIAMMKFSLFLLKFISVPNSSKHCCLDTFSRRKIACFMFINCNYQHME